MWLNLVYDHKILDIEKILKKSPIFFRKSVDKGPVLLLYYSSTQLEKVPVQRAFETSSKNF